MTISRGTNPWVTHPERGLYTESLMAGTMRQFNMNNTLHETRVGVGRDIRYFSDVAVSITRREERSAP